MQSLLNEIIISSYDDLENPVYAGGGAVAVHEIARRLAAKYKVKVITGTYKNSKNKVVDGVSYVRVGTDRFGHKIGQLIFQFALIPMIRKGKFDVWIEASTPPFTFSLLPIFSRKKPISWVNMLASSDMQRKYFFNFKVIENTLAQLYKSYIVPSNWVESEIKKLNKKSDITKIPYGYEHKKLNGKKKFGLAKYFLFMGRIEIDQKGLDLLILSLLHCKDVFLVIAGSGEYKEEERLKNLIRDLSVEDKIMLVGKVRDEVKANLLQNAQALIMPSRFETFGMVALEAIGYQKKVVCFDIPQLSWIPREFSYKVAPFDVAALAKVLQKLTKNNTKINKKSSEEFLRKFNWDKIVSQFEKKILQDI